MRHNLTQRTLAAATVAIGLLATASACDFRDFAERAVRKAQGFLSEQRPCDFGKPGDCPAERVCAYVSSGSGKPKAECVKRYVGATPFVRFPFSPDHPVACIQGTETPEGQHPRPHNTVESLYALDLASRDDNGHEAAAGTVYAAIDGTALVYRSCANGKPAEDPGKPANDDPCGNGFGNHVRILNQDGIMAMYAHLGSIFLEDGQVVHAGEAVGREGKSGRAFKQHLHFSVHFTPMGENWLETLSYYRGTMGVVPPSIPFELQYCDPSRHEECHRMRTRMERVPCSAEHAPLLRADWRN